MIHKSSTVKKVAQSAATGKWQKNFFSLFIINQKMQFKSLEAFIQFSSKQRVKKINIDRLFDEKEAADSPDIVLANLSSK